MAPGRACGSLAGLSFAQLPLFITTAGRHNIDKGLRCLAAEILCDASQVSRLRHTHTHRERERERVCPPPRLTQTHDYPPSRRLFRGDACQRVPRQRLQPERTEPVLCRRIEIYRSPSLFVNLPDERLSHPEQVGIEDWGEERRVIDVRTRFSILSFRKEIQRLQSKVKLRFIFVVKKKEERNGSLGRLLIEDPFPVVCKATWSVDRFYFGG